MTGRLAVPAYVHPSVDPDVWVRLAQAGPLVRFAVVNAHSGPGQDVDPGYPPVLERLREARVRMVGYVDTDYGRRSVDDVVADARCWVTRYGVRGVFLDQVAGDFEHLGYYAACALGARAVGAQFVVANPGQNCHPGYAEIANVTVTFEGSWREYARYRPSPSLLGHSADRFCHLVYGVPRRQVGRGPALATERHAGSSFFTPGRGANPWDRLPHALIRSVSPARQLSRLPSPQPPTPEPVTGPRWGVRRYAVDA